MRFLISSLIFLASQFSFAQATKVQVCAYQSESCAMAYRVLHGLSKNQEKGTVSAELNIRSLENALNEGKVRIIEVEYQELGSTAKKADYLFKEMLKQSDNPQFQKQIQIEQLPSKRNSIQQMQSGTRGGGFELPEEWWLWF